MDQVVRERVLPMMKDLLDRVAKAPGDAKKRELMRNLHLVATVALGMNAMPQRGQVAKSRITLP